MNIKKKPKRQRTRYFVKPATGKSINDMDWNHKKVLVGTGVKGSPD